MISETYIPNRYLMSSDHDSYDVFLETWAPSRHLEHACLPSYLDDPVALERLLQDVEAVGDVPRSEKRSATYNEMLDDEALTRRLAFLQAHQPDWAADFCERMVSHHVRPERLEAFIDGMANIWTKGYAKRQKSPLMLAVKASIQAHDRFFHQATAGRFVIDDGDFGVEPLFDPLETAHLFQTNSEMLLYAVPDYVEALYGERSGATDKLYVRRGICMPHEPVADRQEASYLSSFSLAIGTTELFAQTMGSHVCTNIPCIVSCPVAASRSAKARLVRQQSNGWAPSWAARLAKSGELGNGFRRRRLESSSCSSCLPFLRRSKAHILLPEQHDAMTATWMHAARNRSGT